MAASAALSPVLQEIVSRLAQGLQPERIYLFGSRSSGKARQGSDYDLLVVLPSSNLPRHRRETASYDLLWGLTVPVDVIVMTRAEFKRQAQVKTSLAATTRSKGIVLYERPKDR
jgi:predicted nucleotidyltransferase